jgi:hypothetical protein
VPPTTPPAWPSTTSSPNSPSGGEWQVFLRSQCADGVWWQVAYTHHNWVYAVFGTDALYLLSRRDAPRGKRAPPTEVLRQASLATSTARSSPSAPPHGHCRLRRCRPSCPLAWQACPAVLR